MDINSIKTKNYYHNYVTIKQSDNTSPIELLLCGPDGSLLNTLTTSCTVTLLDMVDNEIRQKSTEQITNGMLSFKVKNDLKAHTHTLEVTTNAGVKFPSDGNFEVFVSITHDEAELRVINSLTRDQALAELDQSVKTFISANTQEYVDKEATAQWLTQNEFKLKEPKQTFGELPTPAELKEVRGVIAENKVYVFDGKKWIVLYNINFDALYDIKVLTTNANKEFGFVGDGVTDNYAAFQRMANYINNNSGANIRFLPFYNDNGTIRKAVYRINRYVTIKNVDGVPEAGSADHIRIKGSGFTLDFNGAKVVNMPLDGYTRSASFHNESARLWYSKEEPVIPFLFEKAAYFTLRNLIVDGENYKTKLQTGFTSKKFDNPRWTDGHGLETGRGHGVLLKGCNNFVIENVTSCNQQVDGIADGFYLDYGTSTAVKSTNGILNNITVNGNGRLGISGLGYANNSFNNIIAENNGMNQTTEGIWMTFNPAGGIDLEPHQSPISNDNTTNTAWKTHLYNGNSTLTNIIMRNNACSGLSVTSTLLTKNVFIKNILIETPSDHPGDYPIILMTAQGVTLEGVELRGKTAAGKLSRIVMYAADNVNSAGVLTGAAANVFSTISGGQIEGCDFYMNDYLGDSSILNDIPSGEYGLHNGVLKDLMCTDCLFRLKHKRKFLLNNVTNVITANSAINSFDIWGGVLIDCVLINQKNTPISVGFGSGDYHSEFERFKVKGSHQFKTGTKQYMVHNNGSESLMQYSYTRTLEYTLRRLAEQTGTSSNSLGLMSNTAYTTSNTAAGVTASKALNTRLELNWNNVQSGISTTNWTIGKDKIVFRNASYDGANTANNERYIYMLFKGLQKSTLYTLSYQLTATPDTEAYYLANSTAVMASSAPRTVTVTFKTDSYGRWGYDSATATSCGKSASGAALQSYQQAFIYKYATPTSLVVTMDQIMLNEGTSALIYEESK
ncbi:hypothetical protein ERX35_007805 [Macrococcus equipercicus]|uniref:Right-handed parallel beta-helix repeat-containing protein n=1 Tax=Macrococcus equipercicus TaxID=69967 RepID=A0ABQ6R7P4_9STAP|nr:hypothetical protein [Macrococcus equipercicus]KAA1039111.1 hypothetical protein ERX35_007805 [Macrococcus equipercicus]